MVKGEYFGRDFGRDFGQTQPCTFLKLYGCIQSCISGQEGKNPSIYVSLDACQTNVNVLVV